MVNAARSAGEPPLACLTDGGSHHRRGPWHVEGLPGRCQRSGEAARRCGRPPDLQVLCGARGFEAIPAAPGTGGADMPAASLGYASATLRRRVAAFARAHRIANVPFDTRHPAFRETLRGVTRIDGKLAHRGGARDRGDPAPGRLLRGRYSRADSRAAGPASADRDSPVRCAARRWSDSMLRYVCHPGGAAPAERPRQDQPGGRRLGDPAAMSTGPSSAERPARKLGL